MKITKIIATFLFLLWPNLIWAQAATPVTVIGMSDYYPYSYLEDGEIKGIYPELLGTIFARMPEYFVTIELLPWKRGLALVKEHQRFAIFPPYKRLEDRPWMSVFSLPYMDEQVVVVCRKDQVNLANLKKFPEDYQGLTFGNNLGFLTPGPAFFELVKAGKIKLTEFPSVLANLEQMRDGLITCYADDRLAIVAEAKKVVYRDSGADLNQIMIETAVISTESVYLGFAEGSEKVFPYRDQFIKEFNQHLLQAKQSGLINKVLQDQGLTSR